MKTREFEDGNDYPGGAAKFAALPLDLAGYQHLAPDILTLATDLLVDQGPQQWVGHAFAGQKVGDVERTLEGRIYRLIPVAKQSDSHEREVAHKAFLAPDKPLAPLPADAKARKNIPIYSGFLKYFPRAVASVAELSRIGNDQHNPGKPLHWDRSKSGDEADALMRHLMQADEMDKDGVPHAVKVAWRGMALAEKFLERQK